MKFLALLLRPSSPIFVNVGDLGLITVFLLEDIEVVFAPFEHLINDGDER